MAKFKMGADTPRAKRAQETRQRVLDAATSLFGDVGYTATDLRSIAQWAGVSTGAVFAHFDGKDELFRAAFPADHHRRRVAEAICIALGGDWQDGNRDQWFEAADRAFGDAGQAVAA